MPTGAGFGGLLTALLPLVGLVTILHGRKKRKRGSATEQDGAFEKRQTASQETERRMAAYLAQRSTASYQVMEDDEQEIRR
jgi:hypothetical protein